VKVVAPVTALTVVPSGMFGPVTNIPAANPLVLPTVTFAEPFTVVIPPIVYAKLPTDRFPPFVHTPERKLSVELMPGNVYAFDATVVVTGRLNVTVVPSTIDATVVPGWIPAPVMDCPTRSPAELIPLTVTLPTV
jgi:hypothetical protein